MPGFVDCVVVPFIEVETSEGEAGEWEWDVIGSVWDGEFQLEILASYREGRQGHSGGCSLCQRTEVSS